MPITVMKNLRRFLKRFLTVTFERKLSLFQIAGIFSRNTLRPGLGAFGRIRVAGCDIRSFLHAM